MSERSGLGAVELAVLAASDTTQGGFRRCSDVLADVSDEIGLGPAYSYPVLCDLARSWRLLHPLIEGNGNFGSLGNDPAAASRYTQCRPSELGVLALAVEAGDVVALPVWLAVGDLHSGGRRPPLPLTSVVTALELLLADVGAPIDELFWPVVLPGGASVAGDRHAYLRGEPTMLRMDAQVVLDQTPRGPRRLILSVPYDVNVDDLVQRLADQGRMWSDRDRFPRLARPAFAPVLDIQDETSDRVGLRIAVWLDEVPDADALLQDVWGVHRMLDVHMPGGPADALRAWLDAHNAPGLASAVAILRDVAEGRGAGRERHVAEREAWTRPPPPQAVLAEWAAAGFTAEECAAYDDLPLAVAVRWQPTGLAPLEIGALLSADEELTPEEWQAFVGAGLGAVAEEWIALGFDAAQARSWLDAGVWLEEARVWRGSALTPADVGPIGDPTQPVLPPEFRTGWLAYAPLEGRAGRHYGVADPPGTRGRDSEPGPSIGD